MYKGPLTRGTEVWIPVVALRDKLCYLRKVAQAILEFSCLIYKMKVWTN